ncbi:MAG: DUF421 domain-containing protein [Alphaproteobacteria bacterium]|nr:DUF421 domain-containing protein [Alphaproteobacteria bacterium]
MFFESWAALGRILVVGAGAYAALVLVLRVSGKRTLSKMNAFDLVVTVSLGSSLATVLLSKTVALAEGVLAVSSLIALQWLVAWASVRSQAFRRIIKAEPSLLFFDGRMNDATLRRERVVPDEVLAAARSAGFADLGQVWAVVLETDGTFSVIGRTGGENDADAMRSVAGYPPLR